MFVHRLCDTGLSQARGEKHSTRREHGAFRVLDNDVRMVLLNMRLIMHYGILAIDNPTF